MQDNRVSIRPVLNLSSVQEEENFQNTTLRPILKLQNDLIMSVFLHFCKKQKIVMSKIAKEHFQQEVTALIKKNAVLRNQLLGIIIGQFTQEEFAIYVEKDTEFNKRILSMMGKRIYDNQQELSF
ncbi:glyoxalase [Tenacibaculum sp. M341]|uniref:glyoxalase n=1 Tax=Tenacibaculum sp. M341 TaxID=2530339 RepID=UPI0010464603|nr:glyoxalase [Tenacibaculum sp. M341]TCI84658.1 glyoxalase [Tenacibaculum sp. M341]